MRASTKIKLTTSWNTLFWLVSFFTISHGFSQQIKWAKLYTLPEEDRINCITQDSLGDMYIGGKTSRGLFFPGAIQRAIIYKLNSEGDTIYSLWPGIYGDVNAIAIDPYGIIKIAVLKVDRFPGDPAQLHLLSMTPEGLIFKRDTIQNILYVTNSCIGKDSSWILCGYRQNDFNSNWTDFYVQRILKDGTIEPFQSLNPNHPDCRANRVEQLPDGKYLVSGYVGSRIATYTLNADLSNAQFSVWYQTPDLLNLNTGSVGQSIQKSFLIGAEGNPSIVGLYDSLRAKIWMKRDTGIQVQPQAMTDGSVLIGYSQRPVYPSHLIQRFRSDSTVKWYLNLRDSLIARGLNGNLYLNCVTFFGDESAVFAGIVLRPNVIPYTNRDPIFIKISNVGIPVSVLSKPKPGPLKNETLAPWPNPTGGTLYLKQHFDKAEIHFYSISGKEMGRYKINFAQSIDVSFFPQGIYLYRAVIDGKVYSGKIVRQ